MSINASSAFQRLQTEYRRLIKDPIPYIAAQPLASNFLEWRYVILGPRDTPYEGGVYQGKIVFPSEYPLKPPSIYMLTPNGRFKINESLCLSVTSYHPDSWNPVWSISSILNGLLSFMCDTDLTYGSIETTYAQKRKFANESLAYNLEDPTFCELFPDIAKRIRETLMQRTKESSHIESTLDNFTAQQQSPTILIIHDGIQPKTRLRTLANKILMVALFTIVAIIIRFILNYVTRKS